MKKLLFLILLIIFAGLFISSVSADTNPCKTTDNKSLDKDCNDTWTALNQSKTATAPLETQLTGIKQRVVLIERDIVIKSKNIADGYANLAKQQQILNATIRDFYIKSYYNSP